jgi:hypothetical protein
MVEGEFISRKLLLATSIYFDGALLGPRHVAGKPRMTHVPESRAGV